LTAGIILIPRWGVGGAALTQSLSYAVSLAFVLAVFIKKNNLKISSFVISSDDFREMSKQIRLVIERVRLKRSKC
ncbi:MAG: hypothetical protein N2662_06825, partial [Bacteroidales bacterium]|nr:hypothetical protein [Bacteroidales bacterium]